MAAASSSVRCKMEYHADGFAAGQSCFICEKADTVEPNGLLGRVQVVISGSSSTRPLLSDDPVHLNCHPDQPIHYWCMQNRLLKQPLSYSLKGQFFCPFDGREMTMISSRTDQASAIDNSSAFDQLISTVALTDILRSELSMNKKDAILKMSEANKAFDIYQW